MSQPQTQELSNKKPAWSWTAAITGFSVGSAAAWGVMCAAPVIKTQVHGRNSMVVGPVAGLTALYFGSKYTGLSPQEEATYLQKLQVEEDAKAAAKKAKEDAKKAKEAKKNITL